MCVCVLQLIRMLLIIVGVFFICWSPKLLLNAMKKHQLDVLQTDAAFDVSVSRYFNTSIHTDPTSVCLKVRSH